MGFSLFIIFSVLYNFERDSVLLKYGTNTFSAFIGWALNFVTLDWGDVESTGQTLVLLHKGSNSIGVISYVFNSLFYGISGLLLAFTISTVLTYKAVFNNSTLARAISAFFNFFSGIHILFFCFILKIVLGHEEGFHLFILFSIAIGSYTYSDISQYQTIQFQRMLSADYITAARSWGDSVLKHARRSIAMGLLTQWNSLLGTVFASSIIAEYFFKIRGTGYAIKRYLIDPNIWRSSDPVESEFFMVISALIIVSVMFMTGLKEILYKNLSKV